MDRSTIDEKIVQSVEKLHFASFFDRLNDLFDMLPQAADQKKRSGDLEEIREKKGEHTSDQHTA